MRTREVYLLKDETLMDSQTRIVDLDVADPISFLEVRYQATNGATSAIDHQIHDDVSAIEVVDGSDVLESLSMLDWQALNFYHLGRIPHQDLREAGGAVQMESIIIPFGRYPMDPELYLDARKFRNPQLRLTHSFTVDPVNGFTSGSGKLTVIAHVMEEGAAPPKGFLMAKVQKAWATAASGEEIASLPLDYPYRLLVLRSLRSLWPLQRSVSRVKLSVDHDRWVPLDMDTVDLIKRNRESFGMVRQVKEVRVRNGDTALTDVYSIEDAGVAILVSNNFGTVTGIAAERLTFMVVNMATVATPAWQTSFLRGVVRVLGDSLHSTLAIPLGRMERPDTWLNPAGRKDIRLITTQADAGADAVVILQQLRGL